LLKSLFFLIFKKNLIKCLKIHYNVNEWKSFGQLKDVLKTKITVYYIGIENELTKLIFRKKKGELWIMEVKEIMNSPGLLIASAFMMVVLIGGCFAFLKASLKEAENLNMDKQKMVAGVRSACITTVGPALACVVVLVSFLNIFGAPTTWMRLNDVGADRKSVV